MMRGLFRKRGRTLIADDESTKNALAKIKDGSVVATDFKIPRNIKFHRKFFKLIDVVYDNQEEPKQFATKEKLRAGIKMAAGLVDQVYNPVTKQTLVVPSSMAFEKMDEQEFSEFYNRAVDIILAYVLPNNDKEGLEAQVADLLGFPQFR